MEFSIIDFFIGFTLLNGMAHIVIGSVKVRFLSLFGFSNFANFIYGLLNVIIGLVLFQIQYGLSSITNHGMVLGALLMIIIYLSTGRFFFNKFKE